MDLASAASTCASGRFENMKSAKESTWLDSSGKLIPNEKSRYLERSCPWSREAARNKALRQRMELRIVFIFISAKQFLRTCKQSRVLLFAHCSVTFFPAATRPGNSAFSKPNSLQGRGKSLVGYGENGPQHS